MQVAGLVLTTLVVSGLISSYVRTPRQHGFGGVGWTGLAILCGHATLLSLGIEVHPALGALAWSGYVAAVDSAVYSLRGRSLIRSAPRSFVWLAALSVFLWMPFEWYNLQLAGWYRSGLPIGPFRYLVLGWSFACIWPALLETADLLLALARREVPARGSGQAARWRSALPVMATGAACLVVPLLVPRLDLGEHLLPLTAIGFLLVVDPLNGMRGGISLLQDWSSGGRTRLLALSLAGLLCCLACDGLNSMASTGWHSIATLGAGLRLFDLPLPAYLAAAAFGPQAFAMHAFAADVLDLPRASVPSGTADNDD